MKSCPICNKEMRPFKIVCNDSLGNNWIERGHNCFDCALMYYEEREEPTADKPSEKFSGAVIVDDPHKLVGKMDE